MLNLAVGHAQAGTEVLPESRVLLTCFACSAMFTYPHLQHKADRAAFPVLESLPIESARLTVASNPSYFSTAAVRSLFTNERGLAKDRWQSLTRPRVDDDADDVDVKHQ